jgi:hypothetical protein
LPPASARSANRNARPSGSGGFGATVYPLEPGYSPWLQGRSFCIASRSIPNVAGTTAQVAFDLQHPAEVALTPRAERMHRDRIVTVACAVFAQSKAASAPPQQRVGIAGARPIVVAAVDLAGDPALADARARLASRRRPVCAARLCTCQIARLAIDPWRTRRDVISICSG